MYTRNIPFSIFRLCRSAIFCKHVREWYTNALQSDTHDSPIPQLFIYYLRYWHHCLYRCSGQSTLQLYYSPSPPPLPHPSPPKNVNIVNTPFFGYLSHLVLWNTVVGNHDYFPLLHVLLRVIQRFCRYITMHATGIPGCSPNQTG